MAHLKEDGVTPKSRPDPSEHHVAAFEADAKRQRAIRTYMTKENVGWNKAAEFVDANADHIDEMLAELDKPSAEAAKSDELKDKMKHDPSVIIDTVADLVARVAALEAK